MKEKPYITAVIPAYNEENTIGDILKTLKSCGLINKIILINDGSTDRTLEIVKQYNVEIINLDSNMGKSQAVKYGCSNLKTDILFLCDGDLIGFKEYHAKKILEPVLEGESTMSIGLRDYGTIQNYIAKMFPLISGERAIVYSVFKEMLSSKYFYDYGMEPVMNHYCEKNKLKVKSIALNYNHVLKTKKMKVLGLILLIRELLHIFYICLALKINGKQKI